MHIAVKMAASAGWEAVILKSDSAKVVSALKSASVQPVAAHLEPLLLQSR
ncbi:hypothetical protein TIFTF001_056441 [Ficus carica]|uniref:Uncharacterized protein n=1 Tax=Ficus carica TaxID=3494 RepID=A0AA88EIU4_FICCA|nr:hypothetical protein TIFTF001_056441 [Ficus carica]